MRARTSVNQRVATVRQLVLNNTVVHRVKKVLLGQERVQFTKPVVV
jgi:hypothetical protein